MTITPVEQLKDTSKFSYLMPLWTGKSFIYIPIYKHYRIFETSEGIKIAFKKSRTSPEIGKQIIVIGRVKENRKQIVLFAEQVEP